jgi:hypothetical protein
MFFIYCCAFVFAGGSTKLNRMKKPFTEQEEEIMNLLVEAHNKFVEMKQMHPDDLREWVDGIHKCQNVLKGRVVTRDYPDIFYNIALGK